MVRCADPKLGPAADVDWLVGTDFDLQVVAQAQLAKRRCMRQHARPRSPILTRSNSNVTGA